VMPQSLRERISQAAANIDKSQFRRTWEIMEYLVDILRVRNEAYIEYLYINVMSFHAVFKLFHAFMSVTVSKIN
jgi:uncharacterized Rmd1/YagE family protein